MDGLEKLQRANPKRNFHSAAAQCIPDTLEDLKSINAFYESPVGKRILVTLPQIMQESMKIGQEWGEKIGRQAVEKAKKDLEKEQGKNLTWHLAGDRWLTCRANRWTVGTEFL